MRIGRGPNGDWDARLERRAHRRIRPGSACEVFLGARRYEGVIEDLSRDGGFVRIDVDAPRGALLRVRWDGVDRFARVVHRREVARSLRWALSGGVGLRWERLDGAAPGPAAAHGA